MKKVARDRASHYLARADAYFKTMNLAFSDPEYQGSVPLLAIHSAIALADAISVGVRGQRASDPNHREAPVLLRQLCTRANR